MSVDALQKLFGINDRALEMTGHALAGLAG